MDNIALFYLIFNLHGQNPILDSLMIFGTNYLIYLAVFLILILAARGSKSEKDSLKLILIAFPISALIIYIFHFLFSEQRPYITYNFLPLVDVSTTYSFPSIHTSFMFLFAFAYIFYKSKWASLLLVLAIEVGVSRIFVGVHYPLDIAGGIIVGMVSIIIAIQIKKRLKSSQ